MPKQIPPDDDPEMNTSFSGDGQDEDGVDEEILRQILEEIASSEPTEEETEIAWVQAMRDLPLECPKCGKHCWHYLSQIQASFLGRAYHLAGRLRRGIEVYGNAASFLGSVPQEVVDQIYSVWRELTNLHLVFPMVHSEGSGREGHHGHHKDGDGPGNSK